MLRPAVRTDIAGMQRVRMAVRENRLVSRRIPDDEVRKSIEDTGRGWVVEDDGEIAAFVIGNETNGNIWALFVHPDHEDRGFGGLLHDTVVEWLWTKGLDYLWLTTEPGTRAQEFYESRGWRSTGETDGGDLRYELIRPADHPNLHAGPQAP